MIIETNWNLCTKKERTLQKNVIKSQTDPKNVYSPGCNVCNLYKLKEKKFDKNVCLVNMYNDNIHLLTKIQLS